MVDTRKNNEKYIEQEPAAVQQTAQSTANPLTFATSSMYQVNMLRNASIIENQNQKPKAICCHNTNKTQNNQQETKTYCGYCYAKDSFDSRCCGACYCCCPKKDIKEQCHFCPSTFSEYWYSGYVQTSAGYGNKEEDVNGVCCWLCFIPKFAIFFPCFFGSLCNSCVNILRNTKDINYLL